MEEEGEVSGLVDGVKRSLFNFLDAAERLAPHDPGENFGVVPEGGEEEEEGSSGGVFGTMLTCVFDEVLKNVRPQRDGASFADGRDEAEVFVVVRRKLRIPDCGSDLSGSSLLLPNLNDPLTALEGSDCSCSSFSKFVTRSSRREYANANVLAKSSTGRRCNNVIFSENAFSSNSSRCDLIS